MAPSSSSIVLTNQRSLCGFCARVAQTRSRRRSPVLIRTEMLQRAPCSDLSLGCITLALSAEEALCPMRDGFLGNPALGTGPIWPRSKAGQAPKTPQNINKSSPAACSRARLWRTPRRSLVFTSTKPGVCECDWIGDVDAACPDVARDLDVSIRGQRSCGRLDPNLVHVVETLEVCIEPIKRKSCLVSPSAQVTLSGNIPTC